MKDSHVEVSIISGCAFRSLVLFDRVRGAGCLIPVAGFASAMGEYYIVLLAYR